VFSNVTVSGVNALNNSVVTLITRISMVPVRMPAMIHLCHVSIVSVTILRHDMCMLSLISE